MNGKPLPKQKDKPRKEKAKPAKWWKLKNDDLLQDVGRKLTEKCEVCGGKNEVRHHYHRKSSSSYLRFDWRNCIPLCHSCHYKHHFHNDPHIHNTINRKRGQEWIDELERDRRKEADMGVKKMKEINQQLKSL